MSELYAIWNITLHTECPECEEYFDLIEQDGDFWSDGGRADMCEQDTARTKNVDVSCPECGHEFKVDFIY